MNKKTLGFMATTLLGLLVGLTVGLSIAQYFEAKLGDQTVPGGYFTVEVRRANGDLVLFEDHIHNLITAIGKRHARNLFGYLNASIVQSENRTVSLSLSTDGSPSDSWTKLPNEITTGGLDRKGPTEVTVTVLNSTAYKTEYTWTASATHTGVQCAGVHWWSQDNSNNNLYSCGTFTSTNLNSGDTIKITYTENYG